MMRGIDGVAKADVALAGDSPKVRTSSRHLPSEWLGGADPPLREFSQRLAQMGPFHTRQDPMNDDPAAIVEARFGKERRLANANDEEWGDDSGGRQDKGTSHQQVNLLAGKVLDLSCLKEIDERER